MSARPDSLDITTQRVTVDYQLDDGPARHRIGLIALDSDVATERDFHNMLPDDVMFYTTRIPCFNPVTVENLRRQAPLLTEAVRKLLPNQRLDAVAYSCTSGTVAIGFDKVAELIRAGDRPDVTVVTPITSALAALGALGMQRISLLTPYVDSVNQAMRGSLEENGISVANIGSFCLDDDIEMAEVPPEAIYQAALETCGDEADGLFISCTALRAVETIERIEAATAKPVVTAIQALFWQSLRESGYTEPVEGYGRFDAVVVEEEDPYESSGPSGSSGMKSERLSARRGTGTGGGDSTSFGEGEGGEPGSPPSICAIALLKTFSTAGPPTMLSPSSDSKSAAASARLWLPLAMPRSTSRAWGRASLSGG